MNLILRRTSYTEDGIFGFAIDEQGDIAFYSLEHAYPKAEGSGYEPKIPSGVYKCVRGEHRLTGMLVPFETFEIMEVPGHMGLLFHCGNYDRDSSGCILVGSFIIENMLKESKIAFTKFMNLQDGLDSFELTVK